ncbi:olfactory receptor 5V1-like [Hyla sarda]|uniref:olfactory receptor 5V1-like n=1 Tax=Hyla sarda TaxID=327740 RepID=UPI0024C25843|nr:olfactory receptor 5V1-like [Hyla sarda]
MMDLCENTTVSDFYILGFSSLKTEHLLLFFVIMMLVYLLTIFGNLVITTLICLVPKLHTPMYFFVSNLSVVDIMYISSTLPKLLSITITQNNRISFTECIAQLFFFTFSAVCDMLVLMSMAFDRYVAICKPLQYILIMNRRVCIKMAAFCWTVSAMNSLLLTMLTAVLHFCNSHEISHLFCDFKTMTGLSSSDTTSREILMLIEDIVFAFVPFFLTILSYVKIISTILKISSPESRLKAFSSCTSHLTTVILFYGPIIIVYSKPESEHSKAQDNLIYLLYVVVVPMLNPFVYSLRNKDVLDAVRKLISRKIFTKI